MSENQHSLKDYFEKDYLIDMETYRKYYYSNPEAKRPSICRHHIDYLIRNDKARDYKNFENFLICNYELNLINQVMHFHFNDKFLKFQEILTDFIDIKLSRGSGCSVSSPAYFLFSFTQFSRGKIKFSKDRMLEADIFFKYYLIDMFNKYPELNISWEQFESAILQDKDKDREIKYLKQSLS